MYATDEIKTAMQSLQQAYDALDGDSRYDDERAGIHDLMVDLGVTNDRLLEDQSGPAEDEASFQLRKERDLQQRAARGE